MSLTPGRCDANSTANSSVEMPPVVTPGHLRWKGVRLRVMHPMTVRDRLQLRLNFYQFVLYVVILFSTYADGLSAPIQF
jgi:hypothetical protein